METAVDEGKVRQLGLSNFYRLEGKHPLNAGVIIRKYAVTQLICICREDVQWAYAHARIKPKVIQNRFYAESGHDVEIRAFCKEHHIEYQS
jgi:diketogulonate reductase-like aldo/keto reductase